MKILYVAPEHVSGTLTLFKQEHERRGDVCRFVTFWHSRWDFPDDICLNLRGMPNRSWVRAIRRSVAHDPYNTPSRIVAGKLPVWNPNPLVRAMFSLRDEYNWRKIRIAIKQHDLLHYDVLHLDGGADFTRMRASPAPSKRRTKVSSPTSMDQTFARAVTFRPSTTLRIFVLLPNGTWPFLTTAYSIHIYPST